LRGHRRIARFHHFIERASFMRSIAFHRLDEIGDEIVPLPQLHAAWFRCGSASIRPMMAQIMGMTMTARMITVEVDIASSSIQRRNRFHHRDR